VDNGQNWIASGSATDGYYWLKAHGPQFSKLFEAIGRYQKQVKQVLPAEWTILAKIDQLMLRVPPGKDADLGWDVDPVAILLPGTTLIVLDEGRAEGAGFAGETEIQKLISGSFSVTSVPADVSPDQLVRIYVTALKEKNWDLHLECIDPENRKFPQQIDTLRYYWEVCQKGLTKLHVHADPAEVQAIRVISGGKDESLEDFFDDPPKEGDNKPAVTLVERVTVKVRLFGENGYQSAKPRFVTLIRRDKGRWYIYSGSTLTF
jgi:hypothetical protein